MGAGTSSFTQAETKNLVGVLYDEEAKRAFAEHCLVSEEDGIARVSTDVVARFAAQHPRLQERGAVFFTNLAQFAKARSGLQRIYDQNFTGSVTRIAWRLTAGVGDEHRQVGLDGAPAATLDALYAVAELARPIFEELVVTAIFRAGGSGGAEATFFLPPLKHRERAAEKAANE